MFSCEFPTIGKWKNAAETTKREVRVDGLKLGTTYDVRVRAWHGKKLALGKFGRTLFGLGEENTKTTKVSMKGIKGMRKDAAAACCYVDQDLSQRACYRNLAAAASRGGN